MNSKIFFCLSLLLLMTQKSGLALHRVSRLRMVVRTSFKNIAKFRSHLFKRFFHRFGKKRLFSKLLKKNIFHINQHVKRFVLGGVTTGAVFGLKELYKAYVADSKTAETAESEIRESLSYKAAKALNWGDIEDVLQKLTKGGIKNKRVAQQEIAKALKREVSAIQDKNLSVYHAMPIHIFLALSLYTSLLSNITKEKVPEDFFYIRTFESIEYTKNFENGLSCFADQVKRKKLVIPTLFSGNLFLFAGYIPPGEKRALDQESVWRRRAQTVGILLDIVEDICSLYNISDQSCRDNIRNLILGSSLKMAKIKTEKDPKDWNQFDFRNFESQQRGIVLQFIFQPSKTYVFGSLKRIFRGFPKKDLYKGRSFEDLFDGFYVGYDPRHVFGDFYWAQAGRMPCNVPSFEGDTRFLYNGSEMFEKTLYLDKAHPDSVISQVTLIVTERLLDNKEYRVYPIDVHNQLGAKVHIEKELVQETLNVIKQYKK